MLLINIVANFDALHVFVAPQSLDLVFRVTGQYAVLAALPSSPDQTGDLEPQSRLQYCKIIKLNKKKYGHV